MRQDILEQESDQGNVVGVFFQPGMVSEYYRHMLFPGEPAPFCTHPERVMDVDQVDIQRVELFLDLVGQEIDDREIPVLDEAPAPDGMGVCFMMPRVLRGEYSDRVISPAQSFRKSFDGDRHSADERRKGVGEHCNVKLPVRGDAL